MKILIVEDNDILRSNIKKYFEVQGFEVDEHSSYTWSVHKIMMGSYDAIILDLWLWIWDHDGIDICTEVRNKWNNTPILMLTARTLVDQKIQWLESWADDYLTKPFDYKELLVRVQTITRRDNKYKWNIIQHNDINIDTQKREVLKSDTLIQLSKLEYNLLVCLLQNKGVVMKKERLIEKVWWDLDLFENTRKLDIYIWYLRKKLWKELVETVHGVWYIIQ